MYNSKDDEKLQELVVEIFNPFSRRKKELDITPTIPQHSEFVAEFLEKYPEYESIKGLDRVDEILEHFNYRNEKDLINFATRMSGIGGVDFGKDMKIFMANKLREK